MCVCWAEYFVFLAEDDAQVVAGGNIPWRRVVVKATEYLQDDLVILGRMVEWNMFNLRLTTTGARDVRD